MGNLKGEDHPGDEEVEHGSTRKIQRLYVRKTSSRLKEQEEEDK